MFMSDRELEDQANESLVSISDYVLGTESVPAVLPALWLDSHTPIGSKVSAVFSRLALQSFQRSLHRSCQWETCKIPKSACEFFEFQKKFNNNNQSTL